MKLITIFYSQFKHYIHNISWIMGQKILAIFFGFFVTVLVARYLGPESYGVLSYAVSVMGIISVAGHMGLDGLIIKEIVQHPYDWQYTLGTSAFIKMIGIVSGFVFLFFGILLFKGMYLTESWVLLIVASSLFFKPFEVVDFWFQAHVQAKYPALALSTSFIIVSIVKIFCVYNSVNIIFFACTYFLQSFLGALFLVLFFHKKVKTSLFKWKFSFVKAKDLLFQGRIIFLGAILASLYLKIDQIMLKWIVGVEEVGIYAVAASISEAWYFVPVAIVTSVFPNLLKLKEKNPAVYAIRLQQLFDLLFFISLAVAIFMTCASDIIISNFFGAEYQNAASILSVHIWAGVFISMRAAFSKWILIENFLTLSLITQGCGMIFNVGLNFLLIPYFKGTGAAIATLISYAMASYISLLLFPRSRPIFWMMSRSMITPLRYPLKIAKRIFL